MTGNEITHISLAGVNISIIQNGKYLDLGEGYPEDDYGCNEHSIEAVYEFPISILLTNETGKTVMVSMTDKEGTLLLGIGTIDIGREMQISLGELEDDYFVVILKLYIGVQAETQSIAFCFDMYDFDPTEEEEEE